MVKNLPVRVGDPGSIPGSGRSPREGNGNPLQYSCLENPTDRGAWWATVLGVGCKESGTTLCVSLNITIFACLNIKRNIRKEQKSIGFWFTSLSLDDYAGYLLESIECHGLNSLGMILPTSKVGLNKLDLKAKIHPEEN